MRILSTATLLLLCLGSLAISADSREITGRVVDDAGHPVAGAAVGHFWRANGPSVNSEGKPYDMKREEDIKALWGNLGRMEPSGIKTITTGEDGRFSINVSYRCRALMAMDPTRKTGGLALLARNKATDPVEIRLGPLLKIRGSIEGPANGERPPWTHVYVLLPEDPTQPLASDKLVSCGSFDAKFEVSLPPSRYVIEGYNDAQDAFTYPYPEVDTSKATGDIDLGALKLSPSISSASVKIAKAKAAGTWIDHARRIGNQAPEWHLTDARGIDKSAKISDFKGKWVILYFWGFGCAPCLKNGLPELSKFVEENSANRDRFEVIGICVDDDGLLKSMADVDKKLDQVVTHVWNGKRLPFPIALDASFKTMESFGRAAFGPILIDPEGRLAEGDEKRLAETLKATKKRP